MTLVSISALTNGPVATRAVEILFSGDAVDFGGFAALLGSPSLDSASTRLPGDKDVYLFGYTPNGLQVARTTLDGILKTTGYTYFHSETCNFTTDAPELALDDDTKIYMPGTFSSGSVFYSPYFQTFIMVYFNKWADSTFYIRYLDLEKASCGSSVWIDGGKNGNGIGVDDAEALVWYSWSSEQVLYKSPAGKGGFNYAGFAHPEFFNRQYLSPSLYDGSIPVAQRKNDWYGMQVLRESDAGGDGKNLLLSWTSELEGGVGTGIYQVMMAMVEFDRFPTKGSPPPSMTTSASLPSPTKLNGWYLGDPNSAGTLRPFHALLQAGSYGMWNIFMLLLGSILLASTLS